MNRSIERDGDARPYGESEQFAQLRSSAMTVAQLYGCEADIQESDWFPLESPLGMVGLKVVVGRRSRSGELRVQERNVRIPRVDVCRSVATIVREAAAELPDT